jgi:hypothetical protein
MAASASAPQQVGDVKLNDLPADAAATGAPSLSSSDSPVTRKRKHGVISADAATRGAFSPASPLAALQSHNQRSLRSSSTVSAESKESPTKRRRVDLGTATAASTPTKVRTAKERKAYSGKDTAVINSFRTTIDKRQLRESRETCLCPICFETVSNPWLFPCGAHIVCYDCLSNFIDENVPLQVDLGPNRQISIERTGKIECPVCRDVSHHSNAYRSKMTGSSEHPETISGIWRNQVMPAPPQLLQMMHTVTTMYKALHPPHAAAATSAGTSNKTHKSESKSAKSSSVVVSSNPFGYSDEEWRAMTGEPLVVTHASSSTSAPAGRTNSSRAAGMTVSRAPTLSDASGDARNDLQATISCQFCKQVGTRAQVHSHIARGVHFAYETMTFALDRCHHILQQDAGSDDGESSSGSSSSSSDDGDGESGNEDQDGDEDGDPDNISESELALVELLRDMNDLTDSAIELKQVTARSPAMAIADNGGSGSGGSRSVAGDQKQQQGSLGMVIELLGAAGRSRSGRRAGRRIMRSIPTYVPIPPSAVSETKESKESKQGASESQVIELTTSAATSAQGASTESKATATGKEAKDDSQGTNKRPKSPLLQPAQPCQPFCMHVTSKCTFCRLPYLARCRGYHRHVRTACLQVPCFWSEGCLFKGSLESVLQHVQVHKELRLLRGRLETFMSEIISDVDLQHAQPSDVQALSGRLDSTFGFFLHAQQHKTQQELDSMPPILSTLIRDYEHRTRQAREIVDTSRAVVASTVTSASTTAATALQGTAEPPSRDAVSMAASMSLQ